MSGPSPRDLGFIGAEKLGLGNGLDNIASFGEKFSFVPNQYNKIVRRQIYRCIFQFTIKF